MYVNVTSYCFTENKACHVLSFWKFELNYKSCHNFITVPFFSSTHERKSKTDVIVKHEKYYLKHNTFSEVR